MGLIQIPARGSGGVTSSGEGHITILPFNYSSIVAGTWALGADANYWGTFLWGNVATHAQNDEIQYKVYLAAGTYTMVMLSTTANDAGIFDVQIDGTSIGTIDQYTAGTTYNVRQTITGIVVASSGLKTLKLLLSTKNVASSDYYARYMSIVFFRTA